MYLRASTFCLSDPDVRHLATFFIASSSPCPSVRRLLCCCPLIALFIAYLSLIPRKKVLKGENFRAVVSLWERERAIERTPALAACCRARSCSCLSWIAVVLLVVVEHARALAVMLVVAFVAALVRCALRRLVVTPFVALVVGCSLHRALPWSALLLLLAVQCCHVLGVVVVSASFLRVRRLDCRLVCRLVLFLSVARRLRRLRCLRCLRRLSSSPSLGWSVSLLACLSSCHRLVGLFPTRIKQAG